MTTYSIIRKHLGPTEDKTIETGLSLKAAQKHCKDPETSSRTCKEKKNVEYTEQNGAWFDCYSEE